MAPVLLIVSVVSIVIGVAFVYWPAAFIVAGVLGLGIWALLDLASDVHQPVESP